jgi:CcmD family protein
MTSAERYVTAAYCVIFAIVLVYVLIIALKLQRLEREVDALAPEPQHVGADAAPTRPRLEREVAAVAPEQRDPGSDG